MRDIGPFAEEPADLGEELCIAPSQRANRCLRGVLVLAVALGTTAAIHFLAEHRRSPRADVLSSAPVVPGVDAEPSALARQRVTAVGTIEALRTDSELCPPTIICTRTGSLPSAFLEAVIDHMPGIVVRRQVAVTQINPIRTYFRRMDATAGPVRLSLRVTQSNILDGLGSTTHVGSSVGATVVFVRLINRYDYMVSVSATGPPTAAPTVVALHALAADPRLTTPG